MTPTKTLWSISYILNVRSLSMLSDAEEICPPAKLFQETGASSRHKNRAIVKISSMHNRYCY